MERLRERDLRAVLDVLTAIYSHCDLGTFPAHVVQALPRIVPCAMSTYNTIDHRRGRISVVASPPQVGLPDAEEILNRHIAQHPFIAYREQTRSSAAVKLSDLVSRTRWHGLSLYNEFYRWIGMEHQMGIRLRQPPTLSIGIVLGRDRRDFTERERVALNALCPHLGEAYRNAEAVSEVGHELALARLGVEELGYGIVLLERDGRVRLATPRARRWLAEYFGDPALRRSRLPDALRRWVRHSEAALAAIDGVPPPREPLTVDRGARRLVVRLLSDPAHLFLLLAEQRTALDSASLDALGLTRREAEVLAWVAQGKTDGETALILGMRPRTVGKHLEHIYQKLGVETRTAAAGRALETARGRRP